MLNVYGHTEGNFGVINLNKEHRYNHLTPHFIDDIARGLDTHEMNQITQVVLLKPTNGEHFSNGTDFRTLAYMKKEDNFDAISNYLEKIYQLQTKVAKYNKPIVSIAPGHSFNSGATLLAASGHPLTTLHSQVAFNEVTFGFVPHSGATYYLSRLPGEFGTFLGLTGMSIHGSDAARIEISNGVYHNPMTAHEDMKTIMLAQSFPRVTSNLYFDKGPSSPRRHSSVYQANLELENQLKSKHFGGEENWLEHQKLGTNFREDFIEIQNRVPSSIADAEVMFKKNIKYDRQANANNIQESYLEFAKGDPNRADYFMHNNLFDVNMTYLKQYMGHTVTGDKGVAVNHRQIIDRCFYSNTVEEIMDNLRKETHPFAKKCLEAMEKNSVLSMKLALRMLRKAINLDYTSCLKMEIDVGLNKIQDKDFDYGLSEVLFNARPKGGQKQPKFDQNIKDSDLEKYFEASKWSNQVNVATVKNALLPTRHYYERFTDTVRLWLNEETTVQPEVREHFDKEAKEALREFGIDARDKALTVGAARDHIAAMLAQERTFEVGAERMQQLAVDQILRENYFNKIQSNLNNYINNEQFFYSRVNEHIKTIFEQAYLEKLNQFYEKSKEAQSLEKRRMFIKFKKFLFKSRILQYGSEYDQRIAEQLKNFKFKQIHLKEKWDESWRDVKHPYIEKSPIYHIQKAIGRIDLTLPELSKEYLSDNRNQKLMSALTLDREELEKLQTDILQNPDKYIEMLTQKEPIELARHQYDQRDRGYEDARREEIDYWYRVLNDGYLPNDSFLYYKEYTAYKEWVDSIESKAYDTLLLTVNSLLLSLQNSTTSFEPSEQDSRKQKVGKLQELLSNHKSFKQEKSKKKKTRGSMQDATQSLTDLKSLLNEVLQQDRAFSKMIKTDKSSNPSIAAFQAQMEQELLKLVEIALLNKYGYMFDKKDLEIKLAQLTKPEGWNNQTRVQSQQLRLIDEYLNDMNGQALVQEALNIVKPFFMQMYQNRIDEEADRVLAQFEHDQLGDSIMHFFYYSQVHNNSIQRTELAKKLSSYNPAAAKLKAAEQLYPLASRDYNRKQLIDATSNELQSESQTLEELKLDSLRDTQAKLEAIKKFDENMTKLDRENLEDAAKIISESKDDPRFAEPFINELDKTNIDSWHSRDRIIDQFLRNHAYEIKNHLSNLDHLEFYSKSILDHGLDFSNYCKEQAEKTKSSKLRLLSQRSDKHWTELAEFAQFLSNYDEVQNSIQNDMQTSKNKIESVVFEQACLGLASPYHSLDTLLQTGENQPSILQRAQEELNANAKDEFDRKAYVKQSITDFNQLQENLETQSLYKNQIKQILNSLPTNLKDEVEDLLEFDGKYLSLEKLYRKLQQDDVTQIESLSGLLNTQLLIKDIKNGKVLKNFYNQFYEYPIDVQSLEEIKYIAHNGPAFEKNTQLKIKELVDNINQTMKYTSNKERKQITIGQFLQKFHHSNSEAFVKYTDEQLQKKLKNVIEPQPEIVDWQLVDTRTNPINCTLDMSDKDINDLIKNVMQEQEQVSEEKYSTNNKVLGIQEEHKSQREFEVKQLLREAKRLTKLPVEHQEFKNYYENKLLFEMGRPKLEESGANQIIEEYTNFRIKTCMLNSDFNKRVKEGDNGHIYLKVLKEQIVDELKINEEFEIDNIVLNKKLQNSLIYNQGFHLDLESAYELQNLNNTDSIGYDNLMERANQYSEEGKIDAAQKTALDKMLADYFLDKRSEYKATNKAIDDLLDIFESREKKKKSQIRKFETLEQVKLRQDAQKVDEPHIKPENFRQLMELDIFTSRALQDHKNGLSPSLRKLAVNPEELEYFKRHIPEYYEVFDVRKPADKYVDDKLFDIIQQKFEARRRLEKGMSRRELNAFDQVLIRYLQKEVLLPELQHAIEKDYHELHQGRQVVEQAKDSEKNFEMQLMKSDHFEQRKLNKETINEDAYYKYVASAYSEDARRQRDGADDDDKYNPESFFRFYLRELRADMKRKPREIKPEEYLPKKPWETDVPPFKTKREKEAEYFEQHALYLENKKENQDRVQLFYVLEQFYEKSRLEQEESKKLSEAQKHIMEYFSDPDNTYFFDQNKIK